MSTDYYLQNADAIDHRTLQGAAHGYSPAQIAASIGVSTQMLKGWTARHERFRAVMERAQTLSQSWWEGRAQDGTAQGKIGASVWAKSMAARFPEQYTDRQEQGGIGDARKIEKITWRIVDPKESDA